MVEISHNYPFDPSHGYSLEALHEVGSPDPPEGFAEFWQHRYDRALEKRSMPRIRDTGEDQAGWRVFEMRYLSTEAFPIYGWLLLPAKTEPKRGFIITHGYGGRPEPDFHLPFPDAAILFPCLRGLGRSARSPISTESRYHVLHDIDKRDRYVIGGCVEDVWLGVSMLHRLFPSLAGHIGYLGESFGGGIGALACPWDERINKVHLSLPTFGNHPLRMSLANHGSGASVQTMHKRYPEMVRHTLSYYDAATAARYMQQMTHCALAKFDPFVPPAGQFAIFNALPWETRRLFIYSAGHHEYPEKAGEMEVLIDELREFFKDL